MSFESPLARAIRLASQSMAQGFQRRGQIQRQEEQQRKQRLFEARAPQIERVNQLLAQTDDPRERRRLMNVRTQLMQAESPEQMQRMQFFESDLAPGNVSLGGVMGQRTGRTAGERVARIAGQQPGDPTAMIEDAQELRGALPDQINNLREQAERVSDPRLQSQLRATIGRLEQLRFMPVSNAQQAQVFMQNLRNIQGGTPPQQVTETEPGTGREGTTTRPGRPGPTALAAEAARVARAEEATGERQDEAREFILNNLETYASTLEIPQEQRAEQIAERLATFPEGFLLPEEQAGIINAARLEDEQAVEKRVLEIRRQRAEVGTAEAEEEVAEATVQDEIELIASRSAKAGAEAEVATATVDEEIALAEGAVQELQRNRIKFWRDLQSQEIQDEQRRLQIQQLEDTIAQNNIEFEEGQEEEARSRVLAAAETGYTDNLSRNEERALAAYLEVEPFSDEYRSQVEGIRRETRNSFQAERRQASLRNEQIQASTNLSEQNLRNAQQEFRVEEYDFQRARRMDPVKDAMDFQETLAEAAWAGDTATLEHWRTVLENPDRYSRQAEGLEDLGITKDGVNHLLSVARQERSRIRENDELRLERVRQQVQQLVGANRVDQVRILSDVAENYNSVEQFQADRERLTELRFSPDELSVIESRIRYRQNVESRDQAAERLTTFSEVPPQPEEFDSWRSTFVDLATNAGFSDAEADLMAGGFLRSFRQAGDEASREAQMDILRSRLLRKQIAKADADLAPGSDLGLTVTETISALNRQQQLIESQQEAEGCVAVMNMGGVPVRVPQTDPSIGGDPDVCGSYRRTLEDLEGEVSRLTGVAPSRPEGGRGERLFTPEGEQPQEPQGETPTRNYQPTARFTSMGQGELVSEAQDLINVQSPTAQQEQEFLDLKASFLVNGGSPEQWTERVFGANE